MFRHRAPESENQSLRRTNSSEWCRSRTSGPNAGKQKAVIPTRVVPISYKPAPHKHTKNSNSNESRADFIQANIIVIFESIKNTTKQAKIARRVAKQDVFLKFSIDARFGKCEKHYAFLNLRDDGTVKTR